MPKYGAFGGNPDSPLLQSATRDADPDEDRSSLVLGRARQMSFVALGLVLLMAVVGSFLSPSAPAGPATALDAHDDDYEYFAPGTDAPSFSVDLFTNGSTFSFNKNDDFSSVVPLVVLNVDYEDTWWEWVLSSSKSLDHFVHGVPSGVSLLFVAKTSASLAQVQHLRARMISVMEDSGDDAETIGQRMSTFYFSSETLNDLDEAGSNLPAVLNEKPWMSTMETVSFLLDDDSATKGAEATASSSSQKSPVDSASVPFTGLQLNRLDCQGTCCTAEPQNDVVHRGVLDVGDACEVDASKLGQPAARVLLGTVGAGCTYEAAATKLSDAAVAIGATAGLLVARGAEGAAEAAAAGVVSDSEVDFEALRPEVHLERDCPSGGQGVPVSTLSAADGEALRGVLRRQDASMLQMSFTDEYVPGYFMGVDSRGMLYSLGWRFYGEMDLEFVSSECRYLSYLDKYYQEVSRPALVIPLFDSASMNAVTYEVGSTVKMPPASLLEQFSSMSIDMELECDGTLDNECDKWDHVITMQVTCNETDDSSRRRLKEVGGDANELGRWVTPFRRQVGKWVTDASPMAPMLYHDSCYFTVRVTSSSWLVTASLRFSQESPTTTLKAKSLLPLVYDDATDTFDSLSSYNANRTLSFTVPEGTKQVQLHALITGHGDCEFMPTSHHWQVNDYATEYVKGFWEAGTMWGCADKVLEGSEPNQHGTYFYGRDGWCDGSAVAPVVFDITDAVDLTSGEAQSITYHGQSYGADDDERWEDSLKHEYDKPTHETDGCGGYILMSSSLTFYA